jgi:cyclase
MFRPRVIPVLLLHGRGLVKTTKFADRRYIGDPINAVRIFNDLQVDELCFLDITATLEGREVSVDLVRNLGDEAYMPFAVGGGIRSLQSISKLLRAGAEKIILNSVCEENPRLIEEASREFGSQSIVASIDVRKNFFGKYSVFTRSGTRKLGISVIDYAQRLQESGAGEILLTSIDRDGTMSGYDLQVIQSVSEKVRIPVVCCGGAGSLADLRQAYREGGASALAAASIFVFHGPRKAVLLNYPSTIDLENTFNAN